MIRLLALAIFSCFFVSCRPSAPVPRPRGYAKVELPAHAYRLFDEQGFPYRFEYPVYGNIVHDTVFFGKKPENPYWINVDFPGLGGRIYLSYKAITPEQPFAKLLEDSHKMSFTVHSKRADYIDEQAFVNPKGAFGILYTVGGNAASAYQFIATDSAKHFIRGALYFDVSPNADSLRPLNEFLKKDIQHLLQTLEWRK